MSEKRPQSTATLIGRLRRCAKALDREAEHCQRAAHLDAIHAKNAASWRARANTCLQAAGRLEQIAEKINVDDNF